MSKNNSKNLPARYTAMGEPPLGEPPTLAEQYTKTQLGLIVTNVMDRLKELLPSAKLEEVLDQKERIAAAALAVVVEDPEVEALNEKAKGLSPTEELNLVKEFF